MFPGLHFISWDLFFTLSSCFVLVPDESGMRTLPPVPPWASALCSGFWPGHFPLCHPSRAKSQQLSPSSPILSPVYISPRLQQLLLSPPHQASVRPLPPGPASYPWRPFSSCLPSHWASAAYFSPSSCPAVFLPWSPACIPGCCLWCLSLFSPLGNLSPLGLHLKVRLIACVP